MFRLVVLSAVLAVAAAGAHWGAPAPLAYGHYAAVPTIVAQKEIAYQKNIIEEPTITHVGNYEQKIPTGYSYQKFTQYHNKPVAQDVYAPAVKKILVKTPVERTVYHTAAVATPAVTYAAPALAYAAAPVVKAAYVDSAPVLSYASAPYAKPAYYSAAPVVNYPAGYGAQLVKNVYGQSYPAIYDAPAVYAKY